VDIFQGVGVVPAAGIADPARLRSPNRRELSGTVFASTAVVQKEELHRSKTGMASNASEHDDSFMRALASNLPVRRPGPQTRTTGSLPWRACSLAGSVLIVAYFRVGSGSNAQSAIYEVFSLGVPIATVVGILHYRPTRAQHWWLFAGGFALWAAGDTYWDSYRWFGNGQAPYPSPADIAFLAAYPLLVAGVFSLTRGWGRPRIGDVLDGAIVVVAGTALTWLLLLRPILNSGGSSTSLTALAIATPVADLLLLAGLTQLVFRKGSGGFALRCFMIGIAATLLADAVYSYLNIQGTYTSGMSIDAGWLIAYGLFAVAALHPSMTTIRALPDERPGTISLFRIGLLIGALLVAPGSLIADGFGAGTDSVEFGVVATVTALLVGARVALLQRERQQAQQALAVSEQEYRELFQDADQARTTLAAQNDELRELDGLKDDLIALVSHELRTPLTSIVGYLELVTEGKQHLSEEQRDFLGVADRNANRLLRLVSDLLFVAQAQAGRLTLEKESLRFRDVIDEAVAAALPLSTERGVELSIGRCDDAEIVGDRQRLAQVVDNLLSNALKFTPAGGAVEIRLLAEDDSVALEVADTGIGIPAAEQQKLFSRFFRTEAAMKKAIQGTGLGLSIVKAIVEGHSGEITVASAANRGATFRVVLPRAAAVATDSVREAA
jgi:signal transduction histidine kinase